MQRLKEIAVATMVIFVVTAIPLYPFTRPLVVAVVVHFAVTALYFLVLSTRMQNEVEGTIVVVVIAVLLAILIPAIQSACERQLQKVGAVPRGPSHATPPALGSAGVLDQRQQPR